MVSPTLGRALLTALLTDRSACCGSTPAVSLLLAVVGSNWSLWLTAAVLVRAAGLDTVARSSSVSGVVVVTVPTDQTPVALSYVPWLGAADANVRPTGSRS